MFIQVEGHVMDKGIFFLKKNSIFIFLICSVSPNMHGLLSSVEQKIGFSKE